MPTIPDDPDPDDPDFAPLMRFQSAIGGVALAWNALHDRLARLYVYLHRPLRGDIPLAAWNALVSDKSQREMLSAVAKAVFLADDYKAEKMRTRFPKAEEDIQWLIQRVNFYSERRNTALHIPLFVAVDKAGLTLETGDPHTNRLIRVLGGKLSGEELITEFEWYRVVFATLGGFTRDIHLAMPPEKGPPPPWPDRPVLPTRGQSPTPEKSSQKKPHR